MVSLVLCLVVIITCIKVEKVVMVSTGSVKDINTNTATAEGTLVDIGEGVSDHGHVYSITKDVTMSGTKVALGSKGSTGTFTSQLTGLTAGTTYYVKAYVIGGNGTQLGKEISFKTSDPVVPTVTTTEVTAITTTTASSGGDISTDGGAPVTARGVCWSTSTGPTIANSKNTESGGTGSFTSDLEGLTHSTKYYLRAYATNSAGTAYGNEVTFVTLTPAPVAPTLTTTEITGITQTTATGGGNITSDGGATVSARGVCWSTSTNPTIALSTKTADGIGTGSFTSSLAGLTAGTTYYVRSYATNSVGTAYGNELSFTTTSSAAALVPTITTTAVSALASTTVSSGGYITSDGGAAVTARGVCWSVSANPTIAFSTTSDGTGSGIYGSSLTGLTANTTYYVRAYATNSAGTAYGNEISFTTTIQVTDIDGNKYNTVRIGTQLWMQENLKTTLYRDGTAIPNITDNAAWMAQTSGAYSWYNNDQTNYKAAYGALYNFYAAVDNHNLCPTGWHVPTTAEWTSLVNYLGGEYAAGGKLKESGTDHWTSPNTGATNETAFSAFAGSYRLEGGFAGNFGYYGFWWSSSEFSSTDAMARLMSYDNDDVYSGNYNKNYGFSVRCLQGEGQVLTFVTTTAASGITSTGAISGGNVTSDGNSTVTERGVCWSTGNNPTVDLSTKTVDGSGTGIFTSTISELSPATTFYVRAYATNSAGTAYGNEQSFTTSLSVIHTAGDVSPVTKTVIYGIVRTNITGQDKYWITQSLGADNPANSASDATESAAGWYWQFNRKQGYKHDGSTFTPSTAWLIDINETGNWAPVNDPCAILLGSGWRIPTHTEWIDLSGGWSNYLDSYSSV